MNDPKTEDYLRETTTIKSIDVYYEIAFDENNLKSLY